MRTLFDDVHDDIKPDLSNWKDCREKQITTDALWISTDHTASNSRAFRIPKRTFLPSNDSSFHGLWIPEIPYQMMSRFTQENDVVWSVFGGSGTDYRVAEMMNRKCIINDLNPRHDFIQQGDSRTFDPGCEVNLALVHPPYHDIVKYSEDPDDGSNQEDLKGFLEWFKDVVVNVDRHLKDDGYMVIACSNVYVNSEEIELGLLMFQMVQCMGYTLKSHTIKDFGETKGTAGKDYNLNYYRQLKGGYSNFYGDNIGILRKRKSKNDVAGLLDICRW